MYDAVPALSAEGSAIWLRCPCCYLTTSSSSPRARASPLRSLPSGAIAQSPGQGVHRARGPGLFAPASEADAGPTHPHLGARWPAGTLPVSARYPPHQRQGPRCQVRDPATAHRAPRLRHRPARPDEQSCDWPLDYRGRQKAGCPSQPCVMRHQFAGGLELARRESRRREGGAGRLGVGGAA